MDPVADDPYLWLEDITGDDALDWVRKHNEPTLAELGGERFEQMRSEALEVLDTDARIPYVRRRGDYLYNFWRDAANPRGLWRRTTLQSYRTAEPAWDVIIDVDELARRRRHELGVGGRRRHRAGLLAGADQPVAWRVGRRDCARIRHGHTGIRCRRVRGARGEDAASAGKTRTPCCSARTSATIRSPSPGIRRLVKRWRRGQPLDEAESVFSAASTDVLVAASVGPHAGFRADDAAPRHRLLQ